MPVWRPGQWLRLRMLFSTLRDEQTACCFVGDCCWPCEPQGTVDTRPSAAALPLQGFCLAAFAGARLLPCAARYVLIWLSVRDWRAADVKNHAQSLHVHRQNQGLKSEHAQSPCCADMAQGAAFDESWEQVSKKGKTTHTRGQESMQARRMVLTLLTLLLLSRSGGLVAAVPCRWHHTVCSAPCFLSCTT